MKPMKVSTTIPKLDEFFEGGVDVGSNVLIISDMLIDKAMFGISIMTSRLREGDNGIYFINNKTPEFIKQNISGWDKFRGKVSFIDGISYSLGQKSKEEFQINEKTINVKPYIKQSQGVFEKALKKRKAYGTTAIFDSLDFWVGHWPDVERFITETGSIIRDTRTTSYYLMANIGFKPSNIQAFAKCFDYVLWLKAFDRKGLVLKQLYVHKPKIRFAIPFEITESGISMYIPKILVTGPFHAGKSTTIKALSQKPVSIDRMGTTISLDHGWVERKGMAVDLFGTPGQERFDWTLNMLAKSILGIFLVVDSTKPETFQRARQMLSKIKAKDIPVVILANKQDLKGALPPKKIEKELGFPAVGTVAPKKRGMDEALEKLFNEILKRQSWY
jgi:small GTP-binding protein